MAAQSVSSLAGVAVGERTWAPPAGLVLKLPSGIVSGWPVVSEGNS